MKYRGYFRNIKNDLFSVTFDVNDGDKSTKEIKLGEPPFITQMNAEDKTIYSSTKYQSATCTIVSEDYLFDLYNSKCTDVKVTLSKQDENNKWIIQFVGYVEPTMYKQGFENKMESIDVDIVDGISILKYLKYYPINNYGNCRFVDILKAILNKCCCYNKLYFPKNIYINDDSECILFQLYISEQNFFEERKDVNETIEDLADSCKDVLEKICQYMGVTAIADKENVLMLDYDGIKQGYNDYWVIDLNNNSLSSTTLNYSKYIDGDSYSSNGATIELDKVYNKVTIEDDFSLIDNFSTNPFDTTKLHNVTSSILPKFGNPYKSIITRNRKFYWNESAKEYKYFQNHAFYSIRDLKFGKEEIAQPTNVFYNQAISTKLNKVPRKGSFVAVRYFTNDDVVCYQYDDNQDLYFGLDSVDWHYLNTERINGAFIAQFATCDVDVIGRIQTFNSTSGEIEDEMNNGEYNVLIGKYVGIHNTADNKITIENYEFRKSEWNNFIKYDFDYLNGTQEGIEKAYFDLSKRLRINSISPNYYLCLFNCDTNTDNFQNDSYVSEHLPYVKFPSKSMGGKMIDANDSYIIIKGDVLVYSDVFVRKNGNYTNGYGNFVGIAPFMYPYNINENDFDSDVEVNNENGYILSWLKYGNWWWNGTEWIESVTRVTFKLRYLDANKSYTAKDVIGKSLSFRNTVHYEMGLGDNIKGTAIPLPTHLGVLTETPEFGMCRPHIELADNYNMMVEYPNSRYNPPFANRIYIKGFELNYVKSNKNKLDINQDVIYSNTIDNDNIQELTKIKFNITTYDDRKLAYSNVSFSDSDDRLKFLNRVYNDALTDGESHWQMDNGEYINSNEGLKFEEHLIYKLVNQYKEPRIKLNLSLKGGNQIWGLYSDKTLSNKSFIIESLNRNYRNNEDEITLIEKA